MGNGESSGSSHDKLGAGSSRRQTGSTRSPGLSVSRPMTSVGESAMAHGFPTSRCVDHRFKSPQDRSADADARHSHQRAPPPLQSTQTVLSRGASRYIYSKHSMVFEDEGGVPDNVDARIHRAFKLDMRAALKGKEAEVVEVCHRVENHTLILLYRVKHRSTIPPALIGAMADKAEMTASWHLLDLFREEVLSRCNSDANLRHSASSRLNRRFGSGVFGSRVDSPTKRTVQPSETPNTTEEARRSSSTWNSSDDEAPTFYERYTKALDSEPADAGDTATEAQGTQRVRPAPVDPDYYVQQLHTYTRSHTMTPRFTDEGHQTRQLYRSCHWHALPLASNPSLASSLRLTSPLQDDENSGDFHTAPAGGVARQLHSSDDPRMGSLSTLNPLSEGSQASSLKECGVKPPPPILVMNSSFQLSGSTSSLPQWNESSRYVKLRLPRKSSVSFLCRDPPSETADTRPQQGGTNTVAYNLWNTSNLEDSMSFLSDYMRP